MNYAPPPTGQPVYGPPPKKHRKWPWVLLAVFVGLYVLGSHSSDTTTSYTSSSTPSSPAFSPVDNNSEFLSDLKRSDYSSAYSKVDDFQKEALANAACDVIKGGADGLDIVNTIQENNRSGLTDLQVAYLIGQGVGVYCPQYLQLTQDWANGHPTETAG